MMAMDFSSSGQDFEFDVPQDQLKLLQAIPGKLLEEETKGKERREEKRPWKLGNETPACCLILITTCDQNWSVVVNT